MHGTFQNTNLLTQCHSQFKKKKKKKNTPRSELFQGFKRSDALNG